MTKSITLCEYEFLHCSDRFNPEHKIDIKTFTQLESFVLNNPQEARGNNDDVSQFLKLTSKRGCKVLQAQNYVGVLQTKDGTTIEILPKIGKVSDDDGSRKKSQEKSRQVLIKMLDTALRRRFDFTELMPNPELLKEQSTSKYVDINNENQQSILNLRNEKHDKINRA